MEAKELRIGNIFGFGEMIHKATHWDIRNLRVQELKGKNSLTYKPVPLTQEWLLKFGFQINRQTKEENNIWRCYFEEGFFEIEQIGDCFYLNDNHCHGTEINYVHQLQNLYFALTCEELTIKDKNDEDE